MFLFKEGAAAFYSLLDYFQTLALCSRDVFSLSVKTNDEKNKTAITP